MSQVSHYAKLADMVAPFKPFLSPKVKLRWNDTVEEALMESKREIIKYIKHGKRISDLYRKTSISTDC